MSHSLLVSALESAAQDVRASGNPMLFLNRLESTHPNWHNRTYQARGMGFLSFHWQVVQSFKDARCPSLWSNGVKPFTTSDFKKFGWPYSVTARARAGDFQSLADFSIATENWHNDAHMAVGRAFGIENEMMDPAANIYYREFWRLHDFINSKLRVELRRYDSAGSEAQKIDRLETAHHSTLFKI